MCLSIYYLLMWVYHGSIIEFRSDLINIYPHLVCSIDYAYFVYIIINKIYINSQMAQIYIYIYIYNPRIIFIKLHRILTILFELSVTLLKHAPET